MNFVFPGFLYALVLLAIPVIIHLFNFRRFKKVPFTNVRFLKELKEETTSRSRLKHLLVLASRILAITCLVLAFAQPFIPSSDSKATSGQTAVSVFIDNSFSMEAVGKEGTLFQEALSRAKEIALAYQPSDKFQLLTNDFTGAQQRLLSREEFIDLIQQVGISTSSRTLSEILLWQKDALSSSGAKNLKSFIISDFQKSVYNFKDVKSDSILNTTLLNLASEQNKNIFIDTCFFSSPVIMPGQSCELTVRMRNTGESDVENIPLKVLVNGLQKAVSTVNIAAGSFAEVVVNFSITETGWQRGEVSITDYPITFDDKYFFAFNVEQNQLVYALSENPSGNYLQRLFSDGGYFKFQQTNLSQVDFSTLQQSRLLILNNVKTISSGLIAEIDKYVTNGGTLVIFPDSDIDKTTYNALASALGTDVYGNIIRGIDKVDRIDVKSDVFETVFEKSTDNLNVPIVSSRYDLQNSNNSGRETLLKLQGGGLFLNRYLHGKGKVFLFTIPLNSGFSDFVDNWLFAPTLYRIALLSKTNPAMAFTIGKNQYFDISEINFGGDQVYHFKNEGLKFDIVPSIKSLNGGSRIFFSDQVKQAGNYTLELNQKTVALAGMNYNRNESMLNYYNQADLDEAIQTNNLSNFSNIKAIEGNISKSLSEKNAGVKLWKSFIIAALLFLLLEILLLKFLK